MSEAFPWSPAQFLTNISESVDPTSTAMAAYAAHEDSADVYVPETDYDANLALTVSADDTKPRMVNIGLPTPAFPHLTAVGSIDREPLTIHLSNALNALRVRDGRAVIVVEDATLYLEAATAADVAVVAGAGAVLFIGAEPGANVAVLMVDDAQVSIETGRHAGRVTVLEHTR